MCMCACVGVFGGGRIVGEEERGTGEGKGERRERKGGENDNDRYIGARSVKVLYKIHHVGNGPNPMMLYVKVSGI